MRRALQSSLLSLAVVPALLALPVTGRATPPAHPVAPGVTTLALAGVDQGALRQLRTEAARTAPGPASAPTGKDGVTAAAAIAPAVLTGQLPTHRFDLVAVSWTARTAPTRLAVRVREQGRWSAWTPLQPDGDGPDAGSPDAVRAGALRGAAASAPLMVNGADGVQVRVDTATGVRPAGLAVDLVDGGRSAADDPPSPPSAARAATGQPQIITRAAWGADERLVKAAPVTLNAVKALIVHHTDTLTAYTPDGAYAQVRSLYAFHTKVRGWNDVGYNFVVDRFGRTFEGRRGSLTAPVMGAHAGGFNSETLGVAVLGTFMTTPLTAATEQGLVPLLAWQSAQYGINPAGRVTLVSGGGSYTRFPAGTRVGVYGVSGHRDVDSTDCPGTAAYPRLPVLRARAAALMVPALVAPVLNDAPTTVAGAPVTFTAAVPTRQRWALTATRWCGGAAVRTVAGTATGRISAAWDLRDAAGHPVPPGAYRMTVTSSSPVGSTPPVVRDVEVLATPDSLAGTVPGPVSRVPMPAISPSPGPSASPSPSPSPGGSGGTSGLAASDGCPVRRAAGSDPAVTSVVAGRLAQPDAHAVVLAGTGDDGLVHALAAAPFAAAHAAPLLLTAPDTLAPVVARDIVTRQVRTAWIVGPVSAVSAAVEQQVRALGVTTVTRIAGADRWATAAALATATGAPAHEAVLASGDPGALLDTLVAAGSAAASGRPLLLAGRAGVPASTLAALRALHVTSVVAVGPASLLPDSALGALAAAGVTRRTRVTGADGTGDDAVAVALAASLGATAPADRTVLASGARADVMLLVAAAQARPVLLVGASGLPARTSAWLAAHRTAAVVLVATPGAVPTAVLRAVQDLRG